MRLSCLQMVCLRNCLTAAKQSPFITKGYNEKVVGEALNIEEKGVIIATKVGNQWRADGSGRDWSPSPLA